MRWAEVADIPEPKRRSRQGLLLALGPLAGAAFFGYRGHTLAAIALVALSVVLLLARRLVPGLGPRLEVIAARGAAKVASTLTTVGLGLFYFGLFTPIAVLGRWLGGRSMTHFARGERATYWEPHVSSKGLERAQFAVHRDGRSATLFTRLSPAIALAACLFAVNVVGGGILRARGYGSWRPTWDDHAKAWDPVRGDWYEDYHREALETMSVFEPLLDFRTSDHRGRYINVEGGVRATHPSTLSGRPGPRPIRVGFFGSSAAWGWGARDEHTIPSELVRLGDAKGLRLEVTNHADPAWVHWQDAIRFSELLAAGDRPDLAIFYGGYNELMVQVMRPGGPTAKPTHYMAARMRDLVEDPLDVGRFLRYYSLAHALFGAPLIKVPGYADWQRFPLETIAQAVEANVKAPLELTEHLGDSYGVRVLWFAQPSLYTRKPIPEEKDLTRYFQVIEPLAKLVPPSRIDPRIVDLTHVFDDLPQPLFIDQVHVTEEGNRIIAEVMWKSLEPELEKLGAR